MTTRPIPTQRTGTPTPHFVRTRRKPAPLGRTAWYVPSVATLIAPLPVFIVAVMGYVLGDSALASQALQASVGLFAAGMVVRALRRFRRRGPGETGSSVTLI